MLTLEEYENKFYDDLVCHFAETGADRELDFDWDTAVERLYDSYIDYIVLGDIK